MERPETGKSYFYTVSYTHLDVYKRQDQSRTIVGFWMPNKAWPNCNVNDPSARVLANYGASGV